MATSSWKHISGHEAREYRAYVTASVTSEDATTATISVTGRAEARYMSGYGCRVRVYINGIQVATKTAVINNSSGTVGEWAEVSGTLEIAKGSASKSIACKATVEGETVNGYGGVNGGTATASTTVSVKAITYSAPNAPSGLTSTRSSDTKNVLTWKKPTTTTTKPVTAILIERKVDGGSWSQIASVSGTATSYNDTTTSADHSYQYRIRSKNTAGNSSYVTSGTTYNTPAAPTNVVAARSGENTVELSIANASKTATALEVQRSTDAVAWETVATVTGAAVTSATDSPGGGTFYYRARNTRSDLASDWSPASNAVVTICAPNAPTLSAPASGMVASMEQETLTLEWAHNPIDGSAQTAAELSYSTDGGSTWVTVTAADEQLKEVDNGFAVNSTVTWKVRTKGAHADFGPWSDTRVFYVYQAPSVAFAQPTDGFVIENTPIAIELQYDDMSGTLANATLAITDGSQTVYSRNMGANTACEISASEWLPENGMEYILTVSVRSSTSLTATASREVSVDFILPNPAGITIENDPETGYASLAVYVEEGDGLDPASISIWRESEDGRVLLDDELQAGSGVVDMYAPLNAEYRYIVTSFADSGAANSVTFDNVLATKWAFLYFAGGGIARGMWNPDDSWSMDQDVDFVRYVGREFPVAYMRDSMEERHDVLVTLMNRDEAREFRKMMVTHEPVVAKLWDSLVFHAVPQVQGRPKATVRSYWGEVAVKLTRIDGGAL